MYTESGQFFMLHIFRIAPLALCREKTDPIRPTIFVHLSRWLYRELRRPDCPEYRHDCGTLGPVFFDNIDGTVALAVSQSRQNRAAILLFIFAAGAQTSGGLVTCNSAMPATGESSTPRTTRHHVTIILSMHFFEFNDALSWIWGDRKVLSDPREFLFEASLQINCNRALGAIVWACALCDCCESSSAQSGPGANNNKLKL